MQATEERAMRLPSPLLTAVVLAGLIGFGAAGAAQSLEPQVQNGIAYVSGGIGSPGQREMRAVRNDYNLHLLFAVKGTGEYLADIPVTIADAKGRVLVEATAEGPYFFARLPAGRYRVTAGTGATAITRTVSVGSRGGADQSFYWNEAPR
jgi:hypothetical protein